MPEYARVPLPQSTSAKAAITGIETWIGSAPLRDLLADFGGSPPGGGLAAELEYLEAFSSEHWDFRSGRERFESEPERFAPDRERRIHEAARALGLRDRSRPRLAHYTHVLVLGGMVGSCLSRTGFAAELLAGGVTAEHVTGIGGFRPFGAEEAELAERAGIEGGRFEFDAMEAGVERAFGVTTGPKIEAEGDPHRDPNRSWRIVSHTVGPMTVRAVAAPSSDPDRRRADTADTCRFWAEHVVDLKPGDSVLVVTSSPYVPFQHSDAVACMGLPYDCEIDTVGVEPETGPRDRRAAGACLQEIRSAIRSMRRLREAALAQAAARAPSGPSAVRALEP